MTPKDQRVSQANPRQRSGSSNPGQMKQDAGKPQANPTGHGARADAHRDPSGTHRPSTGNDAGLGPRRGGQ